MELFSIRIQRTFQLVSTQYGVITDGNAENGKDFYIGIPKNG